MGRLKYLVIHCTATREGKDYSKEQILNWFRSRGWRKPGYHEVVHLDGFLRNLVKYNDDAFVSPDEISNGARGYNSISRHISYVGGVAKDGKTPKDTRTEAQEASLRNYVQYMVQAHPNILILGHNEVSPKACPSFNVSKWLEEDLGISRKNIFKFNPVSASQDLSALGLFDDGDFDFERKKRPLWKRWFGIGK